jgi:G3E family GTPase
MIPVTVLTGFLGSGKTTLLARLLRSPAFARTAVIINEFGEVGIDHDLVEASDESFVELETGCLCCMIRGDLEATLADLMRRREMAGVAPFERIVIETSGLADPAPVLNAVMAETGRGTGIALGAVVTTVDAVNGLATLAREPQSVRQVAIADRLILTKTDLLPEGCDPALITEILRLNPRAPLLRAIKGKIDPALLLASSTDALTVDDASSSAARASTPPSRQHPLPDILPHDPGISCITIRRSEPIPALALTLLLETLADHVGADLLRLKAIVHVTEYPERPAVIHGVQHIFHEPQWLDRWPSDDRATRLVLIGRGLSRLWIETLINALDAEVREVANNPPPSP